MRNIKHASKKNNNVIPLNIKIKGNKNMYDITTYLDVKINNARQVVKKIKNDLERGFFEEETGKPIMGGNSLAILCAGFLRGLSPYEIHNKIKSGEELIKVDSKDKKIKYTIKVWKGADFVEWKDIKEKIKSGKENIYRFKILVYDDNEEKEIMELERPPIRRVKKLNKKKSFHDLYNRWLNEWIYEDRITIKLMAIEICWQKSKQANQKSKEKKFIFRHTDNQNKLRPNKV